MDMRDLLQLLLVLLAILSAQGHGSGQEGYPDDVTPIAALATRGLQRVLQGALEEVPGAECRRQLIIFMEGLRNFSDWALAMADATGKPGAGLLRGNLRALGDMDQCVAAQAEAQGAEERLRGKFCLASLHADTRDARVGRLLDVAMGGRRGVENRHRRLKLSEGVEVISPGFVPELSRGELGVCVPSACSGADVEAVLRSLSTRVLASTPLDLDIHVPEHACRTSQRPQGPLGTAHYAFLMLISVIIMMVIIGTISDIYVQSHGRAEKSTGEEVLHAFSLRTSWQQLTSERKEGLGCVSGLRALSTMYIVLAHETFFFPGEPSINKSHKMAESNGSLLYTPLLSSIIVVDAFFTLSGILYSYSSGNAVKEGRFSYWTQLLFRWIRLSPLYYVIILFYSTFLEYLGDGPAWGHFINYNVQSCKDNWIINVLYVNSYINALSLCVPQSWFLSVDMQLAALAPLAVLPLFRWSRRRVLLLMAVLLMISVVANAATVFILRTPGFYRPSDTDYDISMYLLNNHSRTHVHLSPFLVGLFVGYILNTLKNKEIVMNKVIVTFGWIFSILIFITILFGPYKMHQKDHEYNVVEHAAYAALSRLLWAVGMGWVVFACHKGFGGLCHKLLDCYALRVMSRLSYGINLTHFIFFLHSSGRRRVPVLMDEYTIVQTYIADFTLASLLAFLLFVTIESPLSMVPRILLTKKYSKKVEAPSPESTAKKNE